jgi:hypothetical protein
MNSFRFERGCIKHDKIRNETITSDLNVSSINEKMEGSETKWIVHVDRIAGNVPKMIIKYRKIRQRDLGRPGKK